MRIDSHQHFWRLNSEEYSWINPGWPIYRDFLPADVAPLMKEAGMEFSIAVQARQTVEETKWLLELADRQPFIAGVVGWVDLKSDEVEEQLTNLAKHSKFVGVRHIAQDEPDDNFLLRAEFLSGVRKLKQFNLAYNILVFPRQLSATIELARKLPEQPFVLDHMGKPAIGTGKIFPWSEQMIELAKSPNVYCKISGMVTEANWTSWNSSDLLPYLDLVFEAFGPDRLMFGSDWPVCLLAASYRRWFEIVEDYFAQFGSETRQKIFGTNAARFYGIAQKKPNH